MVHTAQVYRALGTHEETPSMTQDSLPYGRPDRHAFHENGRSSDPYPSFKDSQGGAALLVALILLLYGDKIFNNNGQAARKLEAMYIACRFE